MYKCTNTLKKRKLRYVVLLLPILYVKYIFYIGPILEHKIIERIYLQQNSVGAVDVPIAQHSGTGQSDNTDTNHKVMCTHNFVVCISGLLFLLQNELKKNCQYAGVVRVIDFYGVFTSYFY